MSMLRSALVRARSLFRRSAVEHELDDELRYHLERETERLLERGMTARDARAAARRAFGNVEYLKEESRDARGLPALEHAVRDLGGAARLIRKQPGFAAVIVLSLGLGIGGTTAVFTIAYNVLLAPLAVPHPEQLIALARVAKDNRDVVFSWRELTALRGTPGVGTLAAQRTASQIALVNGSVREYVNMHFVDGAFFPMVGVRPLRGRLISARDDDGQATVAVLSQSFAERLFPGDSAVVGRTVEIRGTPFTVVGVTPRSFRGLEYPGQFTAAIPMSTVPLLASEGARADDRGVSIGAADDRHRDVRAFRIVGRLTTQRTRASAALGLAFERCCATAATSTAGVRERLELLDIRRGIGGKDDFRTEVGPILIMLLAGMGLVLVVVCCNIASLLVVRASARQRELAVRLALGASRARLLSQLILESMPLAVLGGAAGLIAAAWFTSGLARGIPEWETYIDVVAFRPAPMVLVFTGGVAMLCGLGFAVYPALASTRTHLSQVLRVDIHASRSRRQGTVARGVVVAQVAVTVVLVTAASLLAITIKNLSGVRGGFATDRVLLVSLETRGTSHEQTGLGPLHEAILERVRAVPGIRAAAMSSMMPMFGGNIGWLDMQVPGYSGAPNEQPSAQLNAVVPGYFATLTIPLVSGRDFTSADGPGSERVSIVSASFARRYFADRDPVGRSIGIMFRNNELTPVRIVGVVADVKYSDLRSVPEPLLHLPLAQDTQMWNSIPLVLRTDGEPTAWTPIVRRAIDAAAPGIRVRRVSDMGTQLGVAMAVPRLAATLAMFASAMALTLSVIGLYGVVAYSVARRTKELGIRIALGASVSGIVWFVQREIVRFVGVGVAIGLPLSYAANSAMRSQFFGVGAHDPVLSALSVALLLAVAALAGAVPARRAARIDPRIALSAE
jgi:predicted permease